MAKDILYGVKAAFIEELDPLTELPLTSGMSVKIDCAESVEMEAQVDEGNEDIKRCADKIMAIARTSDLLYGYNVTLTDNQFDPEIASLMEGGTILEDGSNNIVGYIAPMIEEGATMKPFRLSLFVANYEGDSIKNYVVVVLNKCVGKAPSFTAENDFYAPEFEIKAREASKAGLPIKGMLYYDTIPVDITAISQEITDAQKGIVGPTGP